MDPQFIDRYAPIILSLIAAILGIPTAIMQLASAIINIRAILLTFNSTKKASTHHPRAENTAQKLNSGTSNGIDNRVHNTHQQVGNGSTAINGNGNRTTIDNSKHTPSYIPTKDAQVSNENALSSIVVATFACLLFATAFLTTWPTISWVLAACWILCIMLLGCLVKLLSTKSINSPEHAILNVLYPASLLAIAGGTWLTLLGTGKYNMATIYTTVSGHIESHSQGGMVARLVEAVTASYGTVGFTLLILNFLAVLFMMGTLIQCFKYSINAVIATRRGNITSLSVQEASMSFFLAVMGYAVCQPALAELIVSQFNR